MLAKITPMNRILKLAVAGATLLLTLETAGQNPYLPLWEYIPDGEPYVFEDPDNPGKYRVYIYGSHDTLGDTYCGRDQVVWSAPVENPREWRYDGVVFTCVNDRDGNPLNDSGKGDVLFAPDICQRVCADGSREYFFYPNVQAPGRSQLVARGSRPDGPFEVFNWSADNPKACEGVLGFDPAVFVDDDGRVYGYWGFEKSYGAELDPVTMATVKPGSPIVESMIPSCREEGDFRFFEASSMRKYKGKYIFVYSRVTGEGENGMPACNYSLAYAWSDGPLGPWTYGGTLIDARAIEKDSEGNSVATACPYGNTHGSICRIGRKWWVFYHRQTGTDEYSRQAMVAPIKLRIRNGAVTISEAEYTSEGFATEGLDPFGTIPAGLACYYTNPGGVRQSYPRFMFSGSYVKASRPEEGETPSYPVINNTSGSVVGYKYLDFRRLSRVRKAALEVSLVPEGVDGTITVFAGKRQIAEISVKATDPKDITTIITDCGRLRGLRGKQPLFFKFTSGTEGVPICELQSFRFLRK